MKHVINLIAKGTDQTVKVRAVMETASTTSAYENKRERKRLGNVLHRALREHDFNAEQIEFVKKR